MSGEFVHKTVGTALSQSEFEDVGLHVFNSQAIGDILYATSSTQLSRLAIGASTAVLQVISGVPAWQTQLYLQSGATPGPDITLEENVDSGFTADVIFKRSLGTTSAKTQITGDTVIGTVLFQGYDNASTYRDIGAIYCRTDGSVSASSSPGYLVFYTTPANSTTLQEKMRITSSGLQIADGQNITVASASGCKIATASTQKLGFFGATPIPQPAKASYGNFASIGDIVGALVAIGIFNAS